MKIHYTNARALACNVEPGRWCRHERQKYQRLRVPRGVEHASEGRIAYVDCEGTMVFFAPDCMVEVLTEPTTLGALKPGDVFELPDEESNNVNLNGKPWMLLGTGLPGNPPDGPSLQVVFLEDGHTERFGRDRPVYLDPGTFHSERIASR